MATDETTTASFWSTNQREYHAVVESTFQVGQEMGLTEAGADEPVDPETVTPRDDDRLLLDAEGGRFRLHFVSDTWNAPIDRILDVSVDNRLFRPQDDDPDDEYVGFGRILLEFLRSLAEVLEPVYVSSVCSPLMVESDPPGRAVLPDSLPIELKRLPWLGVYGESLIEQFGGRERVLDTPAWHVEKLSTGSIFIITTYQPWWRWGRKKRADRYLLDGDDTATM